ncbi:GNAT family N-acetyltransferase [Bordetella genomosp. 10]|uniref:GNAT family N-acetyltransferase n=1 Tax=Bordetella genomosp. 10 TaxID=1416804 RepID=A0A261S4I7_9BORD|nr:GNAT family N-acetyltransferase [Bordetella genomosp. 10]OZI31872.1 GNAT family N-acetyltransferase [Bordetella genomosp. 10]
MAEMKIRSIGAGEARALAEALAEVLMDCVAGGASVSFTAPLSKARATQFWMGVADEVERGNRILLIAESDGGRVAGTVQIVTGQPENQPHRADVSKLLVHRDFRRHGVGSKLMAEVDVVAARSARTVLVLDTETGSDAERLYVRAGWTRAGSIPDYALRPYGGLAATTYFYKQLPPSDPR